MMARTIFPGELIGEHVSVIHSNNKSLIGMVGKVVDETKMTLVIETEKGSKVLLKSSITIKMGRTGKVLEGTRLLKRPEERIK